MRYYFILVWYCCLILGSSAFAMNAPKVLPSEVRQSLSQVLVFDGGRVKTFAAMAQETVRSVTGKGQWQGLDNVSLLWSWFLHPDDWKAEPYFRVDSFVLKDYLKIDTLKNYFSEQEIAHKIVMDPLFDKIANALKHKEKLAPLHSAFIRLSNQLSTIAQIRNGDYFKLLPAANYTSKGDWLSLAQLTGEDKILIQALSAELMGGLSTGTNNSASISKIEQIKKIQQQRLASSYPPIWFFVAEYTYYQLNLYLWIIGFYLLALTLLLLQHWSLAKRAGVFSFIAALVLHGLIIIVRSVIAGRPPVSNMYESIIWVSFGCALLALFFYRNSQKTSLLIGCSFFSSICLILSQSFPGVVNPDIVPLEPVLRSNFWLTIHVMVITFSYAAFALAMVLSNLGLAHLRWSKYSSQQYQKYLDETSQLTYRTLQIGVVLLAAGTILGGVWADYSWGRFWGWDPKETWAFIALMGYLTLLHGRVMGWVSSYWLLIGSALAFMGVVMAWYGVNYVLGKGLHSYGFGEGGGTFMFGYVALQLLYLSIFIVHNRTENEGASA